MNYETCLEIEIALSEYFDRLRRIIVPNVDYGHGLFEIDMIAVDMKSRCAYEIEIKVSKGDLIRDKQKRYNHHHQDFRKTYFAIPTKLMPHIEHIPAHCGILEVNIRGWVSVARESPVNNTANKFTDADMLNLARLGTIRLWTIKRNLADLEAEKMLAAKET